MSDGEPIPLDPDLRVARLQAEHERRKWDVVLHVLATLEAVRGSGLSPQVPRDSTSCGGHLSDSDTGAARTDRREP